MLERRQGECDLAYHKRLVYGKLIDKTLSDVDYSELAPYLYGKEYAPDVARRMMYGSCRTLQLMDADEESRTGEDILKELEQKKLELQKERQKFSDQRREYNKLVTSDARNEHMMDALGKAAEELAQNARFMYPDPPDMDNESDTEGVLVFSDWHYGMKTDNIFNYYDCETCRYRVASVIEQALYRIRLHKCNRVHIVVLGDICHGAIHNSTRVASEELVCDQLMKASEILAQSIESVSFYVPQVVVHCTYGNHMRTIQNKDDSIHADNMERLVAWWLKHRLAMRSNIIVNTDTAWEFLRFSSCGHMFVASHGDTDRVESSPTMLGTLFSRTGHSNIEYILLGDKHHRTSYEEMGITVLQCGALCGSDDYANDKRLFSKPSQLLLIVNETDGVDAEYRLTP